MTIDRVQDLGSTIQYVASSGQTVFQIPFPFVNNTDIVVQVGTVKLANGTDYTVSGAGNDTGGSLTLTVGAVLNAIYTVSRDIAIERLTQYQQNGPFTSAAINAELDNLVLIDQQLEDKLGRAIRIPATSTAPSAGLELNPAAFAGAVLTMDVNGNILPGVFATTPVTGSTIGLLSNPQTANELAAGVTPINYLKQQGQVARYQANTVPGTTDMVVGLQAAIDSLSSDNAVVSFGNVNVIGKPLLLRSTTQENVTLSGNSRVSTALGANAIDIHTATQGINCVIFNQNNNPHLHLEHIEFVSSVGFTGVCIYCVEGGGSDSSGQALFSSVFRDIWMGMPPTNNGFLQGGIQNCKFYANEVEECKEAVYRLQGVGCQDNFFGEHSMVTCSDSYILQTDDTNGSIQMTVDGLHAYNHQRGPLICVQNWVNSWINNINLEVAASNSGTTGLFNFNNCTGLTVTNSKAVQRATLGLAATPCIVSGTSQVEFIGGQWQGNIGAILNGSGVMDLVFDGIDFSGCSVAGLEFNGAFTGTVRTRNCKFNNQTGYGVVNQVAGATNWYSENDEFINAGLGGTGGFRNISVSTSGTVVLKNPIIGQNNVSAAATVFVENAGAGSVTIINPTWVGAPPTSYTANLSTGSVQVLGIQGFVTVTYSASMTFNAMLGDEFNITASNGSAFTINAPSAPALGQRITVRIRNTSGSTLGTATWNGIFKMASWTQPGNGNSRAISFEYDGSNWVEVTRNAADIPN